MAAAPIQSRRAEPAEADVTPAVPAGADPGVGEGLHGLVRAGGMTAAFAIDAIREVVPRPPQLLAWPRSRAEVVGAIELRGSIIPVLDLAVLFNTGPAVGSAAAASSTVATDSAEILAGAGQIVMLVRDGNHVFGLLVTEICGVIRLETEDITPIAAGASGAAAAPAAFVCGDHRGLVVDVPALAALEGMPLAQARLLKEQDRAAIVEPALLFAVGEHRMCLAARVVDATVPSSALRPAPLEHPSWIGMLEYKGVRVPVVDTLAMLDIGEGLRSSTSLTAPCLVLRMPGGRYLAMRIDAVHDLVQLRRSEILPLQDFAMIDKPLLAGVRHLKGAMQLVIDGPAVLEDAELVRLSQLEERDVGGGAGEGDTGQSARQSIEPYLLVTLARESYALPLSQIDEILPEGTASIPLAGARAAQAILPYRGNAIPLLDLSEDLGHAAPLNGGFVVIANHGGRKIGFRVEALLSVERLALQVVKGREGAPLAGLMSRTICKDGRAIPVIDLGALIAQQPASAA